jgi:glycosyltransferase involved in cell wall biosynthesis
MPTISVIVPIYNGEQFIHRCVNSILSQTFEDFELILVDDGSTDSCPQICDEYAAKDSRVIVIHGENQGVSIARNVGLAAASGEYVAFCDGDDWFKNTLLERTYSIAEENGSDVVSYNLKRLSDEAVDKNEEETKTLEIIDLSEDNLFDFLYKVVTWQTKGWQACRSIFRRQIIEEHQIKFCDTCGNFAEDLGFTLEYLLYASRVVFVDEYLYYYFDIRQNSMMNTSKKVHKVNEVNELSLYLYSQMKAVLPDEPYCVLHHHITMNQVCDMYTEKKLSALHDWSELIDKLEHLDYFKQQNKKYDEYYRERKDLRGIRYFLSKQAIIHHYLASLNRVRLAFDWWMNKLFGSLAGIKRHFTKQ